MRHRGVPTGAERRTGEHALGLLTNKSGPGSVFAAATEDLATMAVDEVNADGGIRGHPLRLVVGDGTTDPAVGAAEAWWLVRAAVGPMMRAAGGHRWYLAGMWGVAGYFEQLPGEANTSFLHRYRTAFGRFAPPVSSISESAYEAVYLYASAARRAGGDEPRAVARELRSSRSEFPRGPVTITGPETVRQDLFLAEATAGGFTVSPSG